ncbi:MAG: SMC family ATPase [Candidatus Zixiibacteriota bacterium]
MRLHSLAIDNFRVLRQTRLQFSDQVIGIIGPNGAGKSSIVEAIAWALYGTKVARSVKEEIRSTYAEEGADCQVALEFAIGREHYRLERSLVGRTERSEVVLYRGGERESAGTVDTEKYVTQLLGLDWHGFRTSFLARQQELNALADKTPGERRDFLAGMLGIDRLDRAIKLVKDDRKASEQAAQILGPQVAMVDRVEDELKALREHAGVLEQQQVGALGARDRAEREHAQAQAHSREHDAKQTACSRLQPQLAAARQSAEHLARALGELRARETKLAAAKDWLAALEPELAPLENLRAELENLNRRREAAAQRAALDEQVAVHKRELSKTEQDVAEARKALDVVEQFLKEIPSDLAALIEYVSADLEEARRQWSNQKALLAADEKTAGQLREQLESIKQVGPDAVCERCHRPFGDDLPQIQKHLAEELEALEEACAQHRQNLQAHLDRGAALKKEFDRLQQLDRRRGENEVRLKGLQEQADRLAEQSRRLTSQITKLEGQMAALGDTAFDPVRHREVFEKVKKLEAINTEVVGLRGELKALPELVESVAKTSEQASQAKAEVAQLEQELQAIGFDQRAYDEAANRQREAQLRLDEANRAHQEIVTKLEITRRDIAHKEAELARLAEIGKQLEESRDNQYYAEKLVNLFGDFRKYTISRIRPRLAELSSQLMVEMSGGRYSLVELDEDYNLQVMDNGEYFGIDRFSGGEKDLASLCLRLAISLALTESAGLDSSFIILDEVFGSQDAGRRDLIFESLANLKARFPQMLLITHLDELKHKVETLVELVPQPGGWSEVRLNGEAV